MMADEAAHQPTRMGPRSAGEALREGIFEGGASGNRRQRGPQNAGHGQLVGEGRWNRSWLVGQHGGHGAVEPVGVSRAFMHPVAANTAAADSLQVGPIQLGGEVGEGPMKQDAGGAGAAVQHGADLAR